MIVESYREHNNAQIAHRMQWGLALGCLLLVALIAAEQIAYSRELAQRAQIPQLIALGPALVTMLLIRHPRLLRQPMLVLHPMSVLLVTCIGFDAALTTGFIAPHLFLAPCLWIYGSAILPLSPRQFLALTAHNLPILVGVNVAYGWPLHDLLLPAVVLSGAYTFCWLGCFLRHRADLTVFATRAKLAELNVQLEQRVATQVEEIVARADEIEVLNVQLQQRVQERSRELALALARIESTSSADDFKPGRRLGDRAEIVRRLGAGGMGVVYLAIDLATKREVALKVIRRAAARREVVQRFLLEAGTAASFTHPAIARVSHVDVSDDGLPYLMMELVSGTPLDRVIARGPVGMAGMARFGAVAARALAVSHAAGVVHRDIKPSNLMISRAAPGVKLLDFGLAKLLSSDSGDDDTTQSQSRIVGTPAFMSPEQREGQRVTGATDVYSLALVLLIGALGELPRARSFSGMGLAPDEEALLERCLASLPADRPDAAALADALDAIADRMGCDDAVTLAERFVRDESSDGLASTLVG